ncbi:MAG: hypothetical protein PWP23_938 [Candidatus Sumerlaeota bacterium]|nr:hypothetical protein [Candidatus Sumerlaeota bacterium]
MNRRLIIAILALVFLGVVAAVALLVGGGGSTTPAIPDDSAQASPDSGAAPASSQGRYSRTGIRANASDGGNAEGDALASGGTQRPPVPGGAGGLVPNAANGLDTSKYGPEFWRGINLFDDPAKLEELLEEFGSIEGLYAAAPADIRQQLVNYLLYTGELREHLADILPIETDSLARADILMKVTPEGFFDPENEGNIPIDRELISLLDSTMPTPITEDEWLARMELARLIDPDYAMEWAREADDVFPTSDPVKINAAATTLMLSGAGADVSDSERREAESYLFAQMSSPSWQDTDSNDRIQAYYGIYWATDQDRARQIYESALETEDEGEARDVVENLLTLLETS